MYSDDDLPPRLYKKKTSFLGVLKWNGSSSSEGPHSPSSIASSASDEPTCPTVEKSKLEERMARAWHQDLSWREVLVRLEPDAHSNSVVRRRFANAYGWPVIDHLVENHFNVKPELPSKSDLAKRVSYSVDRPPDSYDDSQDLSSLVHQLEIEEEAPQLPTPEPVVPKKSGTSRLVVDCRALNNITETLPYQMPNIDDILAHLRPHSVFSKLDLKDAFHLIRVADKDTWKTAFAVHNYT
jgi:hypothetical protein